MVAGNREGRGKEEKGEEEGEEVEVEEREECRPQRRHYHLSNVE